MEHTNRKVNHLKLEIDRPIRHAESCRYCGHSDILIRDGYSTERRQLHGFEFYVTVYEAQAICTKCGATGSLFRFENQLDAKSLKTVTAIDINIRDTINWARGIANDTLSKKWNEGNAMPDSLTYRRYTPFEPIDKYHPYDELECNIMYVVLRDGTVTLGAYAGEDKGFQPVTKKDRHERWKHFNSEVCLYADLIMPKKITPKKIADISQGRSVR